MVLDYSRFDNIGIDDSDDESDDERKVVEYMAQRCAA